MKSFADILKNKSHNSSFIRGVLSAGLVDNANIFIEENWGEEGKKLAKAIYVKNGVLVIACLSSIMAAEIRLKEQGLLNRINNKYGEMQVKKVRYLS
jgi:hypothetical protein